MTSSPVDSAAALERASALCDLRRYDDALRLLRTLLATDPDNEEGLCLTAMAHLGQDANPEALLAARAAIAQNPGSSWSYRLASLALMGLGQNSEAQAMARTAVRLAPHAAACHIVLAQVLALTKANLGEARAAADRATSLAPHDASTHTATGMVAAAGGRTADATAAYRRALAIEPDNHVAHNELARLQLSKRRIGNANGLANAAGGFARALRADPRADASRSNLDLVLHLFLTWTALGIFVVAWVGIQVGRANDAGLARMIPALLLLVPMIFIARFVLALTPELRRYLARLFRNPFVGSAVACDVIAAGGIVTGAVFAQASRPAFICAGLFAALARLTIYLEGRRKFAVPGGRSRALSNGWLWFIAVVLLSVSVFVILASSGPTEVSVSGSIFAVATGVASIACINVVRRRKR